MNNGDDMKTEEFANILNEDNSSKQKGSKPILLLVIGLLLVALIVVGVKTFLRKEEAKTENVYYTAIDNLADNIVKGIDKADKIYNSLYGLEATAKVNLSSSNAEYKDIFDIINSLDIKFDTQSDYKNKKISTDYEFLYNSKQLVKGNLYVNKDGAFITLGDLYDKNIKLVDNGNEVFSKIWQSTNNENIKKATQEIAKILKKSLKEEYFSREEEEIDVLGKKTTVYKHTLKLDKERLTTLINDIVEGIKNDQELLDTLATMLDIKTSELTANLDQLKEQMEIDDVNIEINTYVNKKNTDLEKVEINASDTIVLNKVAKDKFELLMGNEKLADLTLSDKETTITVKDDEAKSEITISIKDDDMSFKTVSETSEMNVNLTTNNKESNLTISIDDKESDIKGTIEITTKEKTIKEFTDRNVKDYVDIAGIDEYESEKIMNNLYQNSTFMELAGKIMSITGTES